MSRDQQDISADIQDELLYTIKDICDDIRSEEYETAEEKIELLGKLMRVMNGHKDHE